MAHWLIDTGNTKRGVFYNKHQDMVNNGKIIENADGTLTGVLGEEKMFNFHTAVDPRNLKITSEIDGSNVNLYMGLTKNDASFKVPLDLDTIKNYLDSDQAKTSPIVFLSYIFNEGEEEVSIKEAIQNHKCVSKLSKDSAEVIDIKTGEVLWTAPTTKNVVNYMFAGKIAGVPNTYYICLNSFRTELYENLQDGDNHSFDFLDQSVGAIKNMLLRPNLVNASLLDNDIIIAPKNSFIINLFSAKGYFGNRNLTASDVTVNVRTNLQYEKSPDGLLTFDFGDKNTGYVSLHIASNLLLDQDPDTSLRRTFTVHRG